MLGLSSAEFSRHSTTVARLLSNSGTHSALSGHPGTRPVQDSADTANLAIGLSKATPRQCSATPVLVRSGARLFGWSSLHRCNARTPLCSATPVHYSLGARPLQRLVSPRSPCLVLSRSDARHSHFGRSGIRSAELCRSGARPIKDSSASPLRQPLSCPGTLTLVTPVPAISGARIIWRSAAPPLGYSGASLYTPMSSAPDHGCSSHRQTV